MLCRADQEWFATCTERLRKKPRRRHGTRRGSRASVAVCRQFASILERGRALKLWTQNTTMAVASSFDLTALARVLDDDDFDPALEERTRVTCSIFDEYERKPEGGINFISTEEIESQRYAALVFLD